MTDALPTTDEQARWKLIPERVQELRKRVDQLLSTLNVYECIAIRDMLTEELRTHEERNTGPLKALELIWHVHVRAHVHLGLERHSGLAGHCIPCICALALGRTIDYDGAAPAEEFERELIKIRGESHV